MQSYKKEKICKDESGSALRAHQAVAEDATHVLLMV